MFRHRELRMWASFPYQNTWHQLDHLHVVTTIECVDLFFFVFSSFFHTVRHEVTKFYKRQNPFHTVSSIIILYVITYDIVSMYGCAKEYQNSFFFNKKLDYEPAMSVCPYASYFRAIWLLSPKSETKDSSEALLYKVPLILSHQWPQMISYHWAWKLDLTFKELEIFRHNLRVTEIFVW